MQIDQMDVVNSVREHLEKQGYTFSYSPGRYRVSVEISAYKGKEKFIVEAIGESSRSGEQGLIFALGKIVKRMKEQGFWTYYGVAVPKSYFKLLKNFEVAGFRALNLHVFLVDSFYSLTHLSPADAIELITQLQAGKIVNPNAVGIDSGLI